MAVQAAAKCDAIPQNLITLPPVAPDLAVQKRRAIPMLLAGKSVSQVAEAIGVDRATVYRWLKEPQFVAERNRQANEMWDSAQARLQGLVHKSIGVVESALDIGDLKAACAVLKFTGIVNIQRSQTETDARAVIKTLAEEYATKTWLDRPFAEKTLGKQMLQNDTFQTLVQSLWETLQEKYHVGDNEADELLYEAVNRQK